MQELTPIEQTYTALNAHARAILDTGKTPAELDDMFYQKGVELASGQTLGKLGGEVVKYSMDQALVQPGDAGLTPELATHHLATITHDVEQILSGEQSK